MNNAHAKEGYKVTMKATIKDVARVAGVSVKTVSRVINNEQSVKKSTEEKVKQVVKELNYHPNTSARSLAGSHSYTIGFIYDNPNAYYVIDMQNGILSECKKNHYELLIHPCDHKSQQLEDELSHLFNFSRMAGVILTPPFSEMASTIELLEKMHMPYVRIVAGSKHRNEPHCVYIDDQQAGFRITQFLLELGHSRIGFLSGGKNDQSSIQRQEGYQEALQFNKIKPQKQLVIEGEYSFDFGVKGATKLLSKNNRPTALFACNDEIAAGAVFAAKRLGLSVPEDVSITGFEDSPFSKQTWPQLTTAHQPNNLIAQSATSLLFARIQGWSQQKINDQQIISRYIPELVVRESTSEVLSDSSN